MDTQDRLKQAQMLRRHPDTYGRCEIPVDLLDWLIAQVKPNEEAKTMIYGYIHKPSGRTILRLDTAQTQGAANHELPTAESLREFVQQHPEIKAVDFADSRMPRRAVPVSDLFDALLRKFYKAR